MNNEDYIFFQKDFLSKEECKFFIKLFEDNPNFIKNSDANEGDRDYDMGIVDGTSLLQLYGIFDEHFLGRPEQFRGNKEEVKKIRHLADRLNEMCPDDYILNYAQIVKWHKGSFMNLHKDVYETEFTTLIYLNDGYDGGSTVVGSNLIEPEEGKIISFYGAHVKHGVAKTESGVRYTLPAWFMKKDAFNEKINSGMSYHEILKDMWPEEIKEVNKKLKMR